MNLKTWFPPTQQFVSNIFHHCTLRHARILSSHEPPRLVLLLQEGQDYGPHPGMAHRHLHKHRGCVCLCGEDLQVSKQVPGMFQYFSFCCKHLTTKVKLRTKLLVRSNILRFILSLLIQYHLNILTQSKKKDISPIITEKIRNLHLLLQRSLL